MADAFDNAAEALITGARQAAFRQVKDRARAFRDKPRQRDMFGAGLVDAPPTRLIAAGRERLAYEARQKHRYAGLGGDIPSINARAIILLGRYFQRVERACHGRTDGTTHPADHVTLAAVTLD